MEFLSKNNKETAKIAADFVKNTLAKTDFKNKAAVIGLYGELGSGKTTFMKYLAENLGVKETIQSPTFVIMKIYKTSPGGEGFLVHVDAYRIEKEEEMIKLGWNKIVSNPKNLICVEWPEKISGIMPKHIKIFFEHVSENERKIKIDS